MKIKNSIAVLTHLVFHWTHETRKLHPRLAECIATIYCPTIGSDHWCTPAPKHPFGVSVMMHPNITKTPKHPLSVFVIRHHEEINGCCNNITRCRFAAATNIQQSTHSLFHKSLSGPSHLAPVQWIAAVNIARHLEGRHFEGETSWYFIFIFWNL